MDFTSSFNIYNKEIFRRIADKTLSFEKLEERFNALENRYHKEIHEIFDKNGFSKIMRARQTTLSDYFQNIDEYTFSIKDNLLLISMNNGEIIRTKPGSLRRIIINEFEILETHPYFLLLMGYVYTNCLESLCICRAIEAHLDMEI